MNLTAEFAIQVTKMDWDHSLVQGTKASFELRSSVKVDTRVIVSGVDLHALAKIKEELFRLPTWLDYLESVEYELSQSEEARVELTSSVLGPLGIWFRRKGPLLYLDVYKLEYLGLSRVEEDFGELPTTKMLFDDFIEQIYLYYENFRKLLLGNFPLEVARMLWDTYMHADVQQALVAPKIYTEPQSIQDLEEESRSQIMNSKVTIPDRLILKGTSRDIILSFFSSKHWQLTENIEGSDYEPTHITWKSVEKDASVHYVEDPITGFRFFYVDGDEADSAIVTLIARFSPLMREEIEKMHREAEDPEEKAFSLFAAAISCSPQLFNESVFSMLTESARDQDPYVRYQAVSAMSYIPWLQFRDLLQELSDSDEDEEVREVAQNLLELMAQQ